MSPYLRMGKATSGATAAQIAHSSRRGSRDNEHVGSAHDEVELELMKAAILQCPAAQQGKLHPGVESTKGRRVGTFFAGGGTSGLLPPGHPRPTMMRGQGCECKYLTRSWAQL